jgi:hypothetical protein
MKLTGEQQLRIRELHGVGVNEACDKCGKVLAEVRFTIKDQPGEWCSRLCQDGQDQIVLRRESGRNGRPRKYQTYADRQRAYRMRAVAA